MSVAALIKELEIIDQACVDRVGKAQRPQCGCSGYEIIASVHFAPPTLYQIIGEILILCPGGQRSRSVPVMPSSSSSLYSSKLYAKFFFEHHTTVLAKTRSVGDRTAWLCLWYSQGTMGMIVGPRFWDA